MTNNAPLPALVAPAVPPCSPYSSGAGLSGAFAYNAVTGSLAVTGTATLAAGTYCFRGITLSGGKLNVTGPVAIVLTGTLVMNSGCLNCAAPHLPSNLRVSSSYSGANGFLFLAGQAYMSLYATTTDILITPNPFSFFGALLGKTLTDTVGTSWYSNGTLIEYDLQLRNVWAQYFP